MSFDLKSVFDKFYLNDEHQKKYHMTQIQKESRKILPKTQQGYINHYDFFLISV